MKKRHPAATAVYILLAAGLIVILAVVTALNIQTRYNDARPVEFFIAPICTVAAAISLFEGNKKTERALVLGALAATSCADFVMVILNDYYPISLLFFSAAQLCYYARILYVRAGKKYIAASLAVRAALCIAGVIAASVVVTRGTLTAVLAVFYFLNLAANFAEAAALWRRGAEYIIFAAGLLLFIGCDICVGLRSANIVGLAVPDGLRFAVNIAIWLFYVPSQALLALSSILNNRPAAHVSTQS